MINIKELSKKDLPEAEKLYVASVEDNPQGFIQQLSLFPNIKDFIIKTQNDGGAFLGIFLDDEIIGLGGLVKKSQSSFEICKLHIKKEHKGKKFGKQLLSELEKKAKFLSCNKLMLHVTKTQTPAIHLYEKHGFKKTHEEPYKIKINNQEYVFDTIYMEKEL